MLRLCISVLINYEQNFSVTFVIATIRRQSVLEKNLNFFIIEEAKQKTWNKI